ncbi:hypothetical protein BX600DRAFT_504590 [Xylariales sp. PMI_506]|nr:hypothetical protein BX600DRAFT_504590 [Xylariales sp. PMI_506]
MDALMDSFKGYLPPFEGYLPYYLFTLSVIAVGNSLQNLVTLHYTRRMYNGRFVPNTALPPKSADYDPEDSVLRLVPAGPNADKSKTVDQITPLAGRLFGTYTLISSIVRIYASFHLDKEPVYMMALWTYVVALGHFLSEGVIYKSLYWTYVQMLPLFFASVGTIWMFSAKSFYVKE